MTVSKEDLINAIGRTAVAAHPVMEDLAEGCCPPDARIRDLQDALNAAGVVAMGHTLLAIETILDKCDSNPGASCAGMALAIRDVLEGKP